MKMCSSFYLLDQELHLLHILPHSPTLNFLQSESRNHYYKLVSSNQSNMEVAGETKSKNLKYPMLLLPCLLRGDSTS